MLHVCRDFLTTGNPLNLFLPYVGQYHLVIFVRACLGYVVVGQTNFNIDGATLRPGSGTNGSLNQGLGNEYAFLPNGYVVSPADIGRILALKSPANGMVNSGLFRVTGIDTTNNWLFINYRSGDLPPPETGMTWGLYATETVFNASLNYNGNGIAGTYQGQGTATQSRIILQSPSSLNWQVRIAIENTYDTAAGGGGVTPSAGFSNGATCAPGFGGTVAGDFLPGGQHLHADLFYNAHSSDLFGQTVGFWLANSNQARLYMWGDDVSGTVFAVGRTVIGGTDGMVHFGLCEDEELPLPPHPAQRLFVFGANNLGNGGNNGIYYAGGNNTQHGGVAFGLSNQPISCMYSTYTPLFGGTFGGISGNNSIRNSPNAGDSPYIAATELVPVDMIVGTHDNFNDYYNPSPEFQILEGRRLGRAPFVRLGRSNYGYFQVTTDATHSFIHLNDGMYLPWQGSILP
jgi:hypothetical protein